MASKLVFKGWALKAPLPFQDRVKPQIGLRSMLPTVGFFLWKNLLSSCPCPVLTFIRSVFNHFLKWGGESKGLQNLSWLQLCQPYLRWWGYQRPPLLKISSKSLKMASKYPISSCLLPLLYELSENQKKHFLVFHSDFGHLEVANNPQYLPHIFNPTANRVKPCLDLLQLWLYCIFIVFVAGSKIYIR